MKGKYLIPTLLLASGFLAFSSISSNGVKADDEPVVTSVFDPIASYQFQDSDNPGKDSMGNYDLTMAGTVTAADGVATFAGGGALYSMDVMDAIGNEDFTIKATIKMEGAETYAVQAFTDYWCLGKGFGISNWGGNLRGGLDDGINRFGDDHCWSLVLGESCTVEHTVILTVKVGETASYYADGKLIKTAPVSKDFTVAGSNLPFALGGAVWGDAVQGFAMSGTIKDVRVYKTAVSAYGARCLFLDNEICDESVVTPMAKYEFKDSENPGKDTMGAYDLTAYGANVSAADGVATFGGGSALYSMDVMDAIGNEDFTIKATIKMEGAETYAVQAFTDYWCVGKGFGISNWGGNLRGGLDDGINRFGDDHSWSLVLAESSAVEHTVILTLKAGVEATYYADGKLIKTAPVSKDFTVAGSNLPFALGGAVWGDAVQGFGMTGTIKDVSIYKVAIDHFGADSLFDYGFLLDEQTIDPMANYEFKDSENPGKDSMGAYNLTAYGANVSAADGVATFGGGSALYSMDVMDAIGNEDFTIRATIKMEGAETYAIQAFTDYWCVGKGFGVSNWGGNLRGGLDDGINRFGDDHSWSLVLAESSAVEHTIALSVKVGDKATFYADGQLIKSAPVSKDFTVAGSNLPFALGGAVWGDAVQGFGMTGTISGVKIYKQAFGQKQSLQLMKYGEVYESASATVASVDMVDFSDSIIVPADATEHEIVAGYAPVGKQDIQVNMDNGSKKTAKVTWDAVEEVAGVRYLRGTLSNITNNNNVYAYAKIGFDAECVELLPLAKYNFETVDTIGKDAMGNYDLTIMPKKLYEGDEYVADAIANPQVEDGAAVFDGTYSLANTQLGKDLTSATISFDMEIPETHNGWMSPLSFGRDGVDPQHWNIFEVEQNSTMLRYGCCTRIDDRTGHSNIDWLDNGGQNWDWYNPVGSLKVGQKANVTLTADLNEGGHIKVYVNNSCNGYDFPLPDDFSFRVQDGMFCIGGTQPLGLEFFGKISGVVVYDFAATAEQVRIINAAKVLETNAYDGIYATGFGDVTFSAGSPLKKEVFDTDTEETMLGALNKGKVPATMSDGSTVDLSVKWKGIEQNGDKYYAVGRVNYLHTICGAVPPEVRVEIPVTKVVTSSEVPVSSELPVSSESDISSESSVAASSSQEQSSSQSSGKKGCGGSIVAGGVITLIAIAGLTALASKRKED